MQRESLLELAACLGGRADDEGVCCFDLFLQLLRSQVIGSVHIAHLLQQLNAWNASHIMLVHACLDICHEPCCCSVCSEASKPLLRCRNDRVESMA